MSFIAKCVELCAVFGANCASIWLSYQPKLPNSLM